MAIRNIEDLSKEELIQQYMKMRDMLDQQSKKMNHLAQEHSQLEKEHEVLEKKHEKLTQKHHGLELEHKDLKKEHVDLQVNYNDLDLQYQIVNEKYKKLIAAKYMSQRNKIIVDMPTLFDDVEMEALQVENEECEEVEIDSYKRRRTPKAKHIDYSSLEHREEVLEYQKGADICPVCGSKMRIKSYEKKEELVVIPAQVYVRVTKIPVYECEACQDLNEDCRSTYVMAPTHFLFKGSKCSAELLAYILDMKYSAGLPLYALENQFKKIGVTIPRQNMCNWVLNSMQYLAPLVQLMKKDLLSHSYIHADETVTQCLNEEGKPATSTSYMFVYHSNRMVRPIVIYDYEASRSGDSAREFLKGYEGYLTTDAYQGYNKVENVTRTMCNVHALRYFKDAYKLLPKGKEARKHSEEAQAIEKYNEIFHLDNKAEQRAKEKYSDIEKQAEYIYKIRQRDIKPKFDAFLSWLEEIKGRCSGRYTMSRAIQYVLNNQKELREFINDGHIAMDNSICERSIRPFVVIRGRCKFYVSTSGAEVSALIYSLVITCEENGINPYMYFMHIFKELPKIDRTNEVQLRSYLPYSKSLPSYVTQMSKKEMSQILKEEKRK